MMTAVLFDLYETLVTERGTNPVRASTLGPRLGLDPGAFRTAWRSRRPRVLRGQLSFAGALTDVGTELGQPIDPAVVQELCADRVREKSVLFDHLDPDAVAVVRHLSGRGVRVAVVSNCFAEDVEAWPGCAMAPFVDAPVFSFDCGAAKPEPEIYLEALRRLGVDCRRAAFIGDGGDDELLGAARVGLRPAQASWFRGEIAALPAHIPRLSSWKAVIQFVMGSR